VSFSLPEKVAEIASQLQNTMHRAIFMDRDGTVSEEIGYMYHTGLYKPFPWTGPAVRKINESGMKAILITNQSGIERGYFPESQVNEVHAILQAELARYNAKLDAVYFCPHHPETGCDCRKPRPGMLLRAQQEIGIDLEKSYMVGDRYIDVETAHAAGTRSVLVMSGDGRAEYEKYKYLPKQPHFIADNLLEAVESIISGVFA
jgi:D-glycero-D-manno-heptose 1,7-bisphosphate phosphatase